MSTDMATGVGNAGPGMPVCGAYGCAGVDNGTGLCADHHRGLTLTVTAQDALRAFLHRKSNGASSITPTRANIEQVEQAGQYIAVGLELLFSTLFGVPVRSDRQPIIADMHSSPPRWRVALNWYTENSWEQLEQLNDDDEDDIEDEDEEPQ